MANTTRVGIALCRRGWVAAILGAQGVPAFSVHKTLAEILDALDSETSAVIIDIPIGLPNRGKRACDSAAREYLKSPREESFLPAPCRSVLKAATLLDAKKTNLWVRGPAVTVHLFSHFDRIREADDWITPERQQWVLEGHPEIIFARLNAEEKGILLSKRSASGERIRLGLLRKFGIRFEVDEVREELGPKFVSRDELIDAAACLVAAHRVLRDDAVIFPEGEVPLDSRGLRMAIVA